MKIFCRQNDLATARESIPITPVNVADASLCGSRRLMVSDNPESIKNNTLPHCGGTLWHDLVNTSSTVQRHRVFIWHANASGSRIKLGLTIENLSAANKIEVGVCRKEMAIADLNGIISAGISLSKACLGNTMDRFTPVDTVVGPKGNGLILQRAYESHCLLGAIIEFEVSICSGAGNLHYMLRTVASKSTGINLRTILTDPLLTAEVPHPRGSWAAGEIDVMTPLYHCRTKALFNFCAKGGPDQLFTAGNSFDPCNAVENRGLWGVTYHVSLQVSNQTPMVQPIQLSLTPRGGAYAGAFKWKMNLRGIPLLFVSTTPLKETVPLLECGIPPGFRGEACSFRLMHAGAVNLPVALWITGSCI